jgi:protocatechuate 3,4-dioxygenase beta subunit
MQVEQMEDRRMMAADVLLGAVYLEDALSGEDNAPDTIRVSFVGGAAGTTLNRIVIDGDKLGNGASGGDIFFDIANGEPGAFGNSPFNVVSSSGFTVTSFEVIDGGTQLVINLSGFEAGEELIFSIDVDEYGETRDGLNWNAIAEGGEFEGSLLTGKFSAPGFVDLTLEGVYYDFFDPDFAAAEQAAGAQLTKLPGDNYDNPSDPLVPVRTAGAVARAPQVELARISGYVYHDKDNDGIFDTTEAPIAGVTLELLNAAGQGTGVFTTTNAEGYYQFINLIAGTYGVRETQPGGWLDGKDTIGSHGGSVANDLLTGAVLNWGDRGVNYNFGELLPGSIAGRVGANNGPDCKFDNPDLPLAGVTIQLLDANGNILRTTLTDADGRYKFDNLAPGEYQVRELQPEGYYDGGERAGTAGGKVANDYITDIYIGSDVDAVNYDFCEKIGAKLSGYVYHDRSNDGIRNTGEEPIAEVSLKLLNADGTDTGLRAVTDSNGYYQFTNLKAGTYRVMEVHPEAWLDGLDTQGSKGGIANNPGDMISEIVIQYGDDAIEYNFGELLPGSIAGRVGGNYGPDCKFDAPDVLIAGVTIQLLDAQGNVLRTTTTNSLGEYRFDGLAPGEYQVRELQPNGWFDGGERVGSAGGVASTPGIVISEVLGDPSAGFPDTGGFDWQDVNIIPGATGIDNGTYSYYFTYYNPANGQETRPSDAFGPIALASTSTVLINLSNLPASPDPQFSQLRIYRNRAGDSSTFYLAGTIPAPGQAGFTGSFTDTLPSSQLSDKQLDFDGVKASGGSLLVNLQIRNGNTYQSAFSTGTLTISFTRDGAALPPKSFQITATTTVADLLAFMVEATGVDQSSWNKVSISIQNGALRIISPLGEANEIGVSLTSFRLTPTGSSVSQAVGLSFGTIQEANDQNDLMSQIVIGSGVHGVNYDFCEHVGAQLSGYVYHDRDNDGNRDPGEEPIPGVTVKLLRGDGTDTGLTATTNSSGFYQFTSLDAGTYRVVEVHPTGWLDGLDTAGSEGGTANNPGDSITSIPLEYGDNAVEYNFGEILPGSIAGGVYWSPTGDCACDCNNKLPLAGVTVQLLNEQGVIIATTTTDAAGQYLFANLRPGTYTVRELQPAGYFDGGEVVGSEGGVATNDLLSEIVIGSGVDAIKYDFCEIPPAGLAGFVFVDGPAILSTSGLIPGSIYDYKDGVRDAGDAPIANVVLRLVNGTNGLPFWRVPMGGSFDNVPEGYAGIEVLPGYYEDGVFEVTTDANGYYQFLGLPAGSYAVVQVQPAGYIDSLDTPGTNGGSAVNPPLPGQIPPPDTMAVLYGPNVIYSINLVAGDFAVENNFSEVTTFRGWLPPVTPPITPPNIPLDPLSLGRPGPWAPLMLAPRPGEDIYGGSSQAIGYTWHLSVINAGQPRELTIDGARVKYASQSSDDIWKGADRNEAELSQAKWRLLASDIEGGAFSDLLFGSEDAIPVAGDWNGDGVSDVGVFLDGDWYLDLDGDGRWSEGDLWAQLGSRDDLPVTGDWDGDGKTDIGIYGPAWPRDPHAIEREPGMPDYANHPGPHGTKAKNVPPIDDDATSGARLLAKLRDKIRGRRADVIDHVFHYGTPGDVPVTGDWNGEGIRTIGVFRDGQWTLDTNGDGRFDEQDRTVMLGQAGDLPLVGDFNGDGVDDLGVYRAGRWLIDANGDGELEEMELAATDQAFAAEVAGKPIVGDWDGDGIDEPALVSPVAEGEAGEVRVSLRKAG